MKFSIKLNSNCFQAMELLDKSLGRGLVVIEDGKAVGFLTDGDIRRFIIKGGDVKDNISKAMNKEFLKLFKRPTFKEARELFKKNIKLLPIVSKKNEVIEIVDISNFISIPIFDPSLTGKELDYVSDCIESNWISSQGSYVKKFEKKFSEYHNSIFCTTTSSGTSALELAFKAIRSKKDGYVLVPDITFGATLNAVINAGLTPLICPIMAHDYSIDLTKISKEILNKTVAVCPVHLYGSVNNMDLINSLKKKYDFYVIEDCSEALGCKLDDKPIGTLGDIGTFSFFGNKLITTGEGGMVVTKNQELFDLVKLIKNHGMSNNKRYWHEIVGTNARMTNIQAAVGLAQIEKLESIIERKRTIHSLYLKHLSSQEGKLKIWSEENKIYSSYWLNHFKIFDKMKRDKLLRAGEKNHIDLRRCFYPMHILPAFKEYSLKDLDYSVSNDIFDHLICLPSGSNLSEDQISTICDLVKKNL